MIVSSVALAYCRPKMMKRIIHFMGQCQVEELLFYRPFLSAKSYEKSSLYTAAEVKESYSLGLSQIRQTESNLRVSFHTHLKPFLEDLVLSRFSADNILIAEPDAKPFQPAGAMLPPLELLVFGPERGFTDKELKLFEKHQVPMNSFGDMHLRLESAIPFIFGQIKALSSTK